MALAGRRDRIPDASPRAGFRPAPRLAQPVRRRRGHGLRLRAGRGARPPADGHASRARLQVFALVVSPLPFYAGAPLPAGAPELRPAARRRDGAGFSHRHGRATRTPASSPAASCSSSSACSSTSRWSSAGCRRIPALALARLHRALSRFGAVAQRAVRSRPSGARRAATRPRTPDRRADPRPAGRQRPAGRGFPDRRPHRPAEPAGLSGEGGGRNRPQPPLREAALRGHGGCRPLQAHQRHARPRRRRRRPAGSGEPAARHPAQPGPRRSLGRRGVHSAAARDRPARRIASGRADPPQSGATGARVSASSSFRSPSLSGSPSIGRTGASRARSPTPTRRSIAPRPRDATASSRTVRRRCATPA